MKKDLLKAIESLERNRYGLLTWYAPSTVVTKRSIINKPRRYTYVSFTTLCANTIVKHSTKDVDLWTNFVSVIIFFKVNKKEATKLWTKILKKAYGKSKVTKLQKALLRDLMKRYAEPAR